MFFWGRAARAKPKNQKTKKTKKQKNKKKENFRPQAAKKDSGCYGFSRPIRASPQVKKAGSHARMTPGKDRGTGRALRSAGLTGFFQPGSAGTRARGVRKGIPPLALGYGGGAP